MAITNEIVTLFVLVIGAIATFWWRVEARLSDQDVARALLQRELADYKLFVAQNHVSASALKDAETRLLTAIEKLTATVDKLAERVADGRPMG